MARISYVGRKVFVIMAVSRAVRCDPTSRERTNAPRVPFAKWHWIMASTLGYRLEAPAGGLSEINLG
jgi:hypothetical protein